MTIRALKQTDQDSGTGMDGMGGIGVGAAAEDDRKFVVALARGLELLRAFTQRDRLLSNGELAARTGLPKSTVSRLTYTLTRCGYLRHDEVSNRYALDIGAFALAQSFAAGNDLLGNVREPMRAFAREMGAAISIGCRDGLEMIYLDTIRSETALTLGLAPGSRLSMLTSSMGRAFLAVQPESERARWLAALRAQAAPGDITRHRTDIETAIAAAQHAIGSFAQEGCCFSFQDWHPDVNAVAVPFYDPAEQRWLIMSCSGPASSMSAAHFRDEIAPRLKMIVARYSSPPR